MKKRYIRPEIEEVSISMQLLTGSQTMDFMQLPGMEVDDEVFDFNQLLVSGKIE